MIKKLLKSVLTLWSLTLWIGFSYWLVLPIGSYWTNMINSYSQNYDIQITKNWTFLSQFGWLTKKVFVSGVNWSNPIYTFWTERGLPYVVFPSNWQWYYKWYYYCNTAVVPNRYPTTSNGACSSVSIDLTNYSWTVEFFESFLSTLTTDDNVYYWNPWNLSSSSNAFCIWNSYLWKSLCFSINYGVIDWNNTARKLENLNMPEAFNSIDSTKLFDPPWVWNWTDEPAWEDTGWIELESSESAINYFENRYWRDSSICYVWINNSTDLWWTSVSFQEWSWLTIFQLYDQLYWTWDLNHYYVFLNNWLINYEQWFNTSGDPMYLSNYNSWTNQVELYYDNLSFPFANNPIALYFMSNNISLKSPWSTMWSEVVSYCNLKLNDWTFEEIIDQSTKNNITNYTENSNVNKWYNSDWTKKTTDYSQFGWNTWNSNSWSWNLSLSWVEIAFSWNTSLQNTLSNFIDYVKTITNYNAWSSSNWILPKYIVMWLIFVMLFRFLRRR